MSESTETSVQKRRPRDFSTNPSQGRPPSWNRNHACAFLAPGFAVIGTLQMAGVSMCGASLSLTLPICCQICLGKVRITSLVLLVSLKSYCAKYIKQNDNRRLFRSATVVSPGQRTSGLLQSTCVLLHVHGCVAGLS